jgi:hypothetical protein
MLRGWLADETHLRALAATLDRLQAASVDGGAAQRTRDMEAAIAATLEAWLDPACRQRLATRLFSVALHFQGMGLPDRAAQAAATARALLSGVAGSGIPFARLMVEKAFPAGGATSPAAATPVIGAPRR